MRDFVTVEALTTERNQAGQAAGWALFAQVYAKIEPLSGRELIAARALQSPVNVRVTTWYVPGVLPTMRVRFEGRTLNVHAVVDVNNLHKELELSCVEVT